MVIIRRAEHAGSWYEDRESVLIRQLEDWLNAVNPSEILDPPASVIQVGQLGNTSGQSGDALTLPVAGCKAIIAP
jgi:predicted class III extradiol MEMO1 family dioxygenase